MTLCRACGGAASGSIYTNPVLDDDAGQSEYHNQGERVVTGQQLMQAVSDIFLGWQPAPLPGRGSAGYYYLRQQRDWNTPPTSTA
jgi:hypothetical protein